MPASNFGAPGEPAADAPFAVPQIDAARIMARPLLEESPARASALRLALASRAERERSDARRVRSGKMGSNRSPDDYLALAERLERFLAELPG